MVQRGNLTMKQLEWMYYGDGQKYLSDDDRFASFSVSKADADISTSTTGVYSAIYGADVWVQTVRDATGFGLLPKFPFKKSGWRVQTADPSTTAQGSIAETAAVPDTVKGTYLAVSAKPKLVVHTFGVTEMQQDVAEHGDDAVGSFEDLRKDYASFHRTQLNAQILLSNATTADTRFESIDRVVASFGELTAGEEFTTAYTAGDLDIYGIDRDAATSWADAYVNDAGATNTERILTQQMLLDTMSNTRQNGGNSTMWLTGHDTNSEILQLFETQTRYTDVGKGAFTVDENGVQTASGSAVGLTIATLYGLPLFNSPAVVKDSTTTNTTTGISRIYLLDTSDPGNYGQPRLGLRINKPTQYFEAGISTGNPWSVNKIGDEGLFRTMGETIATRFNVHGKIRDLKA